MSGGSSTALCAGEPVTRGDAPTAVATAAPGCRAACAAGSGAAVDQQPADGAFDLGDAVREAGRFAALAAFGVPQQHLHLRELGDDLGQAGGIQLPVGAIRGQQAAQLLGLGGELAVLAVQVEEDVDLGAQQPGVERAWSRKSAAPTA